MAEKTVRLPIEAELWKRFRLLALQRDLTVSEYLKTLVEKEVKRGYKAGR